MQSISMTKVAELMGVNLHVETPHEGLPGVTIGVLGGPLYELVILLTKVLNETGAILITGGYPNLGSFVLDAFKEGARVQSSQGVESGLEAVLERVSDLLDGRSFDAPTLISSNTARESLPRLPGHGHGRGTACVAYLTANAFHTMMLTFFFITAIYCFKKALFLVHAVRIRFGSISPPPFPIPSTKESPIFADNVIPSLLVHLGVIDISQAPGLNVFFVDAGSEESLRRLLGSPPPIMAPENNVPKEGPLLSNDQAFKLRAAAIDACQMIIEAARSYEAPPRDADVHETLDWIREMTLPDLDLWIWSVAKDRADYRALERFAQRDTTFY